VSPSSLSQSRYHITHFLTFFLLLIFDLYTSTENAASVMSSQLHINKKPKQMHPFSFFQRKLKNPVHPKEIYETVRPDGYESNPLYDQEPDCYENLGITPNQHLVHVSCPKCHKHISSSIKTKNSNPISHIATCCGGVFQLHNLVHAVREDAGLDNGSKTARQQKLRKALCQANKQDLALHTWMKLVCLNNTHIYKINDSNFCDVLSCEKTSHKPLPVSC
jgi:hypothetical protein